MGQILRLKKHRYFKEATDPWIKSYIRFLKEGKAESLRAYLNIAKILYIKYSSKLDKNTLKIFNAKVQFLKGSFESISTGSKFVF